MKYQLFELLTYFVIYSFAGWLIESIYKSIAERKLINTGFLKGPFCPIYGIGAIIMHVFLSRFKDNVLLLFLAGFIILSIWEYIVGLLLEKIFNTKFNVKTDITPKDNDKSPFRTGITKLTVEFSDAEKDKVFVLYGSYGVA